MPTPKEAILIPHDPTVVRGPAYQRPPVAARAISDRCLDVLMRLRSPGYLDEALRVQFEALCSDTNMGIMSGTLVLMAASQSQPLGWMLDILLVLGLISLGAMLFTVANEMIAMVSLICNAKTEEDLDSAAKLLADIIGVIGVNAAVGWLIGRCGGKLTQSAPKGSFLCGESGMIAMSRQFLLAQWNKAGMLPEHFAVIRNAARSLNLILIFRNTTKAAEPHLRRGATPKPFAIKAKSDPVSGVTTCRTAAEIAEAINAEGDRYYVVEDRAGKLVPVNGPGKELAFTSNPYWALAEGQVIDGRRQMPVAGDYDLLGVIDPAAMARNLVLISSDGQFLPEWKNPALIRTVMEAINANMDQPRIQHGAWDGFMDVGQAGTTTAFFPDGYVYEWTSSETSAMYSGWGRSAVVMPKAVMEIVKAQAQSRYLYRR